MNRLPESFVARGKRLLNLADFASASSPVTVCMCTARPDVDRQYILRMMLRSDRLPMTIPPELNWLRDQILELDQFQRFHGLDNPFVYVTVRHGFVTSSTDDDWHVDGFSMRVPHVPEQNYIFADADPTEFLVNAWEIPRTFDPLAHNIHTYFQDQSHAHRITTGKAGVVYAVDPYCVHRRPALTQGKMRTFWRISFIPIEIEDDTCTRNSLLPQRRYNRDDVRTRLTAWQQEQ